MRTRKLLFTLAVAVLLSGTAPAQELSEQPPPTDPNLVIVHYHRFDGDYTKPGLWTWDLRNQKTPENAEIMATARTEFGPYFVIDRSLYGNDDSDAERIGMIPRLNQDWNRKDGADKTWTPTLGREVWLLGNDPRVYTEMPDISPQIKSASLDTPNTIVLQLSEPLTQDAIREGVVQLANETGTIVPIKHTSGLRFNGDRTTFIEVVTDTPLDFPDTEYTVAMEGFGNMKVTARGILDDRSRFHTEDTMGAVYTPEKTIFRLFSPQANDVAVVLYDQVTGDAGRKEVAMTRRDDGVWETSVDGDLEGRFYALKVTTDKYGTVELNDPNATNTTGDDGHARITDLRLLDPDGFRPIARPEYGDSPTDAVIYEVHIDDLTFDPDSGVDEKLRGKYLGFAQTGTTFDGVSTGLNYIRELGVTHVQILPPQDFDNDEDKPDFNWGYMTDFFNSPEGTYASDIRSTARVSEFKSMVKAIKDEGIGVIMDVVYNHTGTQNTLERLTPGYYLRMKPDGSFYNGSGTGNEFRSEAPMARKFIVDSMKLWTEEYGMDGFRFDLMGLIDVETLKTIDAELSKIYPEILLYGEPWAGGDVGIPEVTYKDKVAGTGLGAFNDNFRDAIKGSTAGDDGGYIQNGSRKDGVMKGIRGAVEDWARNPTESINYAEAHDNYTLWDKLAKSAGKDSEADRRRMQMLAGSILSVSQGVMFLHAGQEFARTKNHVENSYNAGYDVNMLDWSRRKDFADMVEFHKGLITIRLAHPVFRLSDKAQVLARHQWLSAQGNVIAFTLDGTEMPNETWKRVAVFVNPDRVEREFVIPFEGDVQLYIHGDRAGTDAIDTANGTIKVPPISLTLAAQEK